MDSDTKIFAALFGMAAFGVIIALFFVVIEIVARWQIYKKMEEPGWASLIPFYSDYVMYKHTWHMNWFWVSIVLVVASTVLNALTQTDSTPASIVAWISGVFSLIAYIRLRYGLSKGFGHGVGYTLGLIFFPFIFTLILGFSHTEIWVEEENKGIF